jgi:hypothetical protein
MKTYELRLKGTKKNNTKDLSVIMHCENKNQAYSLAFYFFEKGQTNTIYGREATGFTTIHKWMPDAENLKRYAGLYKVYNTSVICK